jgi:hypothetical protein
MRSAKFDTGADKMEPTTFTPDRTRVVPAAIACIECGRPWLVARERWRLKVLPEDSLETVPYCPDCAHREFDA